LFAIFFSLLAYKIIELENQSTIGYVSNPLLRLPPAGQVDFGWLFPGLDLAITRSGMLSSVPLVLYAQQSVGIIPRSDFVFITAKLGVAPHGRHDKERYDQYPSQSDKFVHLRTP
jgi:hypothetical protein